MAVPTPPPDASGGFMVIKYSNGTYTHRMRVHVAPFNADATGSYVAPPAGQEASVQATAGAFISTIKSNWPAVWTFSLDAVYRVSGGSVSQTFAITPPANQTGTNPNPDNPLPETYWCANLRTVNGGRFRLFLLQVAGITPGKPIIATSTTPAGSTLATLVNYLTGTTTGVRGHDGTAVTGSAKVVYGLNRRIRRRVGDA